MTQLKSTILVAACAIAMTGCNAPSIKEQSVSAALEPMAEPTLKAGYTQSMFKDGKPLTAELVEIGEGKERWRQSTGCRYERIDAFAPSTTWRDCEPFADGKQTLTSRTGTPWPLTVGREWSYSFVGDNANGDEWNGTRHCQVAGTARITVAKADHDTYKVVCDDQFSRRTYYVSPELKDSVRIERWRKNAGETTIYEIQAES